MHLTLAAALAVTKANRQTNNNPFSLSQVVADEAAARKDDADEDELEFVDEKDKKKGACRARNAK